MGFSLSCMTITELKEYEYETIEKLRARANAGDNHAAQVLLEHLRATSKAISEWQAQQPKLKKTKHAISADDSNS